MDDILAVVLVVAGTRADGCRVLDGLDVLRQIAYESGDPARLQDVYAPGAARTSDEHLMSQWRRRGVSLRGMEMQRRSCTVHADRLEVVERLGPTEAVLPDGTRRTLPHDGWDERTISLRRASGRWFISGVTAVSRE